MLATAKPSINEKELFPEDTSSKQQFFKENTSAWVSFLTPKSEVVELNFPSFGTIEFNWNRPEPTKTELPVEPSKMRAPSVVKSSQENVFPAASSIIKLGWSLLRDLFDGFLSVIKLSTQPILTPEQQKAQEESRKKEKERQTNIKTFYEALKSELAKFKEQKYQARLENRQRLGITKLDIATTNQLLSGESGPMRNLSDKDISYDYHDEHAAIALVEKRRADQTKQAAKELTSPARKLSKGPRLIMDMDKQHLSKGGTVTTAGG